MIQKVTIVKVRKTVHGNVNQELQWLGNSLGLFNLRDRDSSCFRVFITLVKKARTNEVLSSDEIAYLLNLSRSTVIHHLMRLMESGIVVKERGGYLLRENNIEDVIRNLKGDLEAMFTDLQNIAKEIDDKLS